MLEEYHCPVCGKIFFPTRLWRYKDEGKLYCSWTCYRKVTTAKEKRKKGEHSKRRKVEKLTLEGVYVRTYKNLTHAAVDIDGTEQGISKACRESKIYKGYLWRYKNDLSQM